jgi:signal peptidase I
MPRADGARPRRLVAGLLALASPGLGLLYLGRARWAFAVPLALLLVWTAAAWSRAIFAPSVLAATALVLLGVWLASIVATLRLARRGPAAAPARWQRWYVYLAFFAGSALIHGALMHNRARVFGYEAFYYPSLSMLETMVWGDYFVCDTWRFRGRDPRRGEVVVFLPPRDPSLRYVGRVIGLPGESVQIEGGVVRIDGRRLDEPYVLPENNRGLFPGDSSTRVPAGRYFILDDNRDNTFDSRMLGTVPRENFHGSVEFIWFSFSLRNGFRPERIGLRPA